jgi:AraC-like DNA-binding protein
MTYESPAIQCQTPLSDVLRQLIPQKFRPHEYGDLRIERIVQFIDRHAGSVGCDLESACRELRLDISAAYAGRLFRLLTGLGVREYAKKRRLLIAAERLNHTDLPVKVIAAKAGYTKPWHFARTFKARFGLSPIEFRKTGSAATKSATHMPMANLEKSQWEATN